MSKSVDVPVVILDEEPIARPGERIEITGTDSTFFARAIFARFDRNGLIVVVAQLLNCETGADFTAADWAEMNAMLASEPDDDTEGNAPRFR